MASPLEISIPTAATASPPGSKPYTLYTISLRQPLRSYTVQKRYSDFVDLNASLTSQAGLSPPAALPKKSWIKSTVSSPDLTETRRQGLESYLCAINASQDSRWRQTVAWKHFLNLPNNATGSSDSRPGTAAALGVGPSPAHLQAAGMDPSIWLDVHRDLKSQLSEARQALRKRDAANTAQAQHDASAEVKRWLVRAGTLISTLDDALAALSAGPAAGANGSSDTRTKATATKTPQLGEGEIRRRRDLLSAAKKERDTAERQLNSYTLRSTAAGGSTASATPSAEQKGNLIRPAGGSTQPSATTSTSRRVLGAPVKETERTRELDNEGVLQLQQQIMQEQDSDVTDLTKVVQRMKEMGIQINDELQLQNQLLANLDKDVDRVGDKINIAKKRIGKIN